MGDIAAEPPNLARLHGRTREDFLVIKPHPYPQ